MPFLVFGSYAFLKNILASGSNVSIYSVNNETHSSISSSVFFIISLSSKISCLVFVSNASLTFSVFLSLVPNLLIKSLRSLPILSYNVYNCSVICDCCCAGCWEDGIIRCSTCDGVIVVRGILGANTPPNKFWDIGVCIPCCCCPLIALLIIVSISKFLLSISFDRFSISLTLFIFSIFSGLWPNMAGNGIFLALASSFNTLNLFNFSFSFLMAFNFLSLRLLTAFFFFCSFCSTASFSFFSAVFSSGCWLILIIISFITSPSSFLTFFLVLSTLFAIFIY